jgi:hypothetical protein
MSSNFDALFDLHRLIVCGISFSVIRNDDFDNLTVELSFEQKFKFDSRVDVWSNWTDQSSQLDSRTDVRRILSSLFETSYI